MRTQTRTSLIVLVVAAIVISGVVGHFTAYTVIKPATETVTSAVTLPQRIVETVSHTVVKVVTTVSTETVTQRETTTYRTVETATLRLSIPVPAKGLLVVIGGRTFDEVYVEIVRWSRKPRPRIGIIPTASSTPIETGLDYVKIFENYGAEAVLVEITEQNCAKTAFDSQYVELIKSLDGVFFTGGDQNRITRCLVPGGTPTPVLEALWDLYLRGGVISGNSAGAAIMSDPMIGGGMDERVIITWGLGFLSYGRVIVDQHFLARGRVIRLVEALIQTGVRVGVGVDEGAALICYGNQTCGVIGSAPVVLFALEGYNETHYTYRLSYLTPGDKVDMKSLRVWVGAGKKPASAVGDTAVDADLDIKTQDGLSEVINLLTKNKEVRVSVISESRKFVYLITAVRTGKTSIYETGLFGALRYTATEITLSISKKKT